MRNLINSIMIATSSLLAFSGTSYSFYEQMCVASHPDSERQFGGIGYKWVAVKRALKNCEKWASENNADAKVCKIESCYRWSEDFSGPLSN